MKASLLSRTVSRSCVVAIAVATLGLGAGLAASPAAAASSAGAAAVMNPDGALLESGGSGTVFGLELPPGAVCPGDTYHHDFLVYSFAVPASVDLSSVKFFGTFPSKGVALVTSGGEPYVTIATELNTGAVSTPPLFSWSRYDHDLTDLPMGLYNVGIACSVSEGPIQRYWDAQIRFTPSASDAGGFTWRVVSRQPGSSSSSGDTAVIGSVALLGVATAIFLVMRRRAGRIHTRPA